VTINYVLKYCIPLPYYNVFLLHYASTALESQHDFFYTDIYLFQFIIIINPILYCFCLSKYEYTGFAFMGITFFKMMASVVFIPLIQARVETNLDIAAFFIHYFLFFCFETVFND
jgi:hypothetical protein